MTRVAVRTISRAPFAVLLVAVLLVTTEWSVAHPDETTSVFAAISTNIYNLTHTPLKALALSALFLPGRDWLQSAAILLAALIPLERRVGTVRTVAVFASAHVIATLLTEGWEYIAIHAGSLPASAVFQDDVGVSYGMYGAAAAACFFLPRRVRALGTAVLAGDLLVSLAVNPGMTTAGHVLCLVIGLCWWPVLSRVDRSRRAPA